MNWLEQDEETGDTVARRHMYTGSFNPEDTFTGNETIISISIPNVIDIYEKKYEAVLHSTQVLNSYVSWQSGIYV
tara:strand:+ start:1217 stop:1441 length:225 start_codon:yes stop_codon:yes gene_type:complete